MNAMEKWTEEELIQVYDLQEKYAEKIVEYVRHEEESEVLKFLQIIPELNLYENFRKEEAKIYRKNEFRAEKSGEEIPQGRFIYKDLYEKWRGADNVREIFDEKYIWDYATAQPEVLAIFAGNEGVALEKYSLEQYEKLRNALPEKLKEKIKNLIMNYPQEIEEKAMRTAVLGYVSNFHSSKLWRYRNENMPEFERITEVTRGARTDTIVEAYDLQVGLKIYHDELKNEGMKAAIREFLNDRRIFEIVYGVKSAELLREADEEVVKLASRYDFVNTEEKLSMLENHKICMYGTPEEKMKIYHKNGLLDVSNKDFEKLLDDVAEKYEREGFSRKYYPGSMKHSAYSHQSFKVVGRCKGSGKSKDEYEFQPYWNIVFEDGQIIPAKADEIISSAINERFYGEQVENFGKRPLEKVLVEDSGKMTLSEGREKISAIVYQLKKNGESVSKLQEMLKFEQKNLSYAR